MIWGISPEPTENQQRFAEKKGLALPLLSDDGSAVIKRYGILNEKSEVLPHPTVVVIDREGVIRYIHTDPNYMKRPPAEDVLAAVPSD